MFWLLTSSRSAAALAADADARDVELAVGRGLAGSAQHVPRQGQEGGHGTSGGKEAAPGDGPGRLRVELVVVLAFCSRSCPS